jgi:glycosyltransferase involved in cell wall biosynthesis
MMTAELTKAIAPGAPALTERVLVIVPAYNEAESLPALLSSLRSEAPFADVLVVNDGSRDATAEVAAAVPGISVVTLPCNLGIGGAVQTGFKFAARRRYDVALQVDGDGQHKPAEIRALVAPILAGRADMTIGSRFLSVQSFRSSFLRRIGIRLFSLVNSWLIGQTISDNTSGFRAYSRKAIEFLSIHYPSDYPEPETVVLLARNGFRLEEVPVEMQDRQGGASSITPWRSVYYMVKVLLAIGMGAVRDPIVKGVGR